MRTQLTVIIIALSILFTCGALAMKRTVQLNHAIAPRQTRTAAIHQNEGWPV